VAGFTLRLALSSAIQLCASQSHKNWAPVLFIYTASIAPEFLSPHVAVLLLVAGLAVIWHCIWLSFSFSQRCLFVCLQEPSIMGTPVASWPDVIFVFLVYVGRLRAGAGAVGHGAVSVSLGPDSRLAVWHRGALRRSGGAVGAGVGGAVCLRHLACRWHLHVRIVSERASLCVSVGSCSASLMGVLAGTPLIKARPAHRRANFGLA